MGRVSDAPRCRSSPTAARWLAVALACVCLAAIPHHAAATCGSFPPEAECTVMPGHLAVVNNSVTIFMRTSTIMYFQSTVTKEEADEVVVQGTFVFGRVDVFVTIGDGVKPTRTAPFASTNSSAPGHVAIPSSALQPGANTLNIMVTGSEGLLGHVTYLLSVTEAGTPTTLYNGVPVKSVVLGGLFQYFTFTSVSATQELSFLLTPLIGNPDLFVSTTQTHPSHTDHQWASRSDTGDSIAVPLAPAGTVYYAAVYGFQSSLYTFLARQGKRLLLSDGVPQHDRAVLGQGHFYTFNVDQSARRQGVTIDLYVQTGQVSVYVVGEEGTPTHPALPVISPPAYNFSAGASRLRPAHITVTPGAHGFVYGRGAYQILVQSNAASSNYTLLAATRAGVTVLRDGYAHRESCDRGEYAYFQFTVPNSTLDVDINVTPLSGDPDVYVSCSLDASHTDLGYPSRMRGHFTWASTQYHGSDTVSISHHDHRACSRRTGGGTYYVAVFGWVNTTYTIMATTDNGMPVTLVDGMPQRDIVRHNHMKQYQYYLETGHKNIAISLTPLGGDPDMFVNVGGTQAPTVLHHQYYSVSSTGRDTLNLGADELCDHCWVRIAVFGYTNAEYVISVTSSEGTRTLQDGVPVTDLVGQGEYVYFQYTLDAEGQTLKFVVTTLSGDADLYVSRVWQHPGVATRHNQTWFANGNGVHDTIAIDDAPLGTYYVAVRGYRNSTFTLIAHAVSANEAEMVTLILGQPQAGSIIVADSFAYYQVLMGPKAVQLTITATPYSGLIGVYVNLCTQNADRCDGADGGFDSRPNLVNGAPNATWTSDTSISRESVQIDHQGCVACSYIIGVYGHTAANFSVSAVTSDQIQLLQQGVPHRDYGEADTYRYYMFTLSEPHQDIIISVTAFTGDPDIFATVCSIELGANEPSDCNAHPAKASHTWGRRTFGSDTLVIPYASPQACEPSPLTPCDYYIGVYSDSHASSFTIVATLHSDRPTMLIDGVPQHGHVNASLANQYVLDVLPGREYISIVVTPDFGDPDVFATLDLSKPGPTNFNYRSLAGSSQVDQIIIQSSDPQYTSSPCHPTLPCRVFVAVQGFTESSYSIVATTDRAATTLQANKPVQSSVLRGHYMYFQMTVDEVNTAISFAVTPINGDPDLFVGTGNNRRPTSSNFEWAAQRTGMDVVYIYPDDGGKCTPPCNYYIGVRGYSDSTFTIVGKQNDGAPTMLVDGVPSVGFLNQSMADQFIMYLPPHMSGVDIVLSPMFGDSDLYVSLNGQTPTSTNRQYMSTASRGVDRVRVRAYDAAYKQFCSLEHVCPVRIAVSAFSRTQYNLVATTSNTSTLLLANVPLRDVVGSRETEYFVFHNDQPGAAITIVLTPISGDPDLFVSTTNPRPTLGHSDWASMRLGGDVLDIYPGELHACTAPCDYYIGVRGFYGNASFVLLAGNHSGAPVRLSNGLPQLGFVQKGRMGRYTTHIVPGQEQLEIAVTPRYGDPDVYVVLGNRPLPTRQFWDYRSVSSWGQDIIAINTTSSAAYQQYCNAEEDCTVQIGVYAFADSEFSIVATTLAGLVRLQAGVPFRDNVGAGEWEYFMFTNPDPSVDITFTLTSFSGDPDMYISATNPRPDNHLGNYTWRSQSIDYDRITIAATSANACKAANCHYYVGIVGFGGAASFQLLVNMHTNSPPTQLIRGQPQRGHVDFRELHFYSFQVGQQWQGSVQFLATSLNADVGLFVVPQNADGSWTKPQWSCTAHRASPTGPVCSRWEVTGARWSSASSANAESVTVNATDVNACTGCMYLIGVASVTDAPTGADFVLTALVAEGMTQLQDGVPVQDTVAAGMYKYYQLSIDEPRTDVSVSLTNYFGQGRLYLSTTNHRPNNTWGGYSWRSSSYQHDMVYIQYTDLASCEARVELGGSCVLYIAVYGMQATSFALTATLDQSFKSPTRLLPGVPINGFVNATKYQYYSTHIMTASNSPVTITVTPASGDPDMYVTTDGREPGVHSYNFRSINWGTQDQVQIAPGHPHYCNNCVVNIAVYGFMTSRYTILVQTANSVARLVDGEPQVGNVESDSYRYYRIAVEHNADVTFTLTPLSGGSPRLVASPNVVSSDGLPRIGDAVWTAGEFGDNIIYIPSYDAHACSGCNYVVGVYGMRNTTFAITASLSTNDRSRVQVLVDGQPAAGVVAAGGSKYFSFDAAGKANNEVTFRVSPRTGSVQLYATNLFVPGSTSAALLPTPVLHMWSTQKPTPNTTRYSITIGPSTPGFDITKTLYTLGVFASSQATFDISATSADAALTLALGASSNNLNIARGAMAYFTLYMSRNDGDLKVGVTPLSGNPQLLISTTHQRPSCTFGANGARVCTNYTWISATSGVDVVVVPAAQYAAGDTFFIGVFGENNALYSIAAWADSHVLLTDGQAQVSATSLQTLCPTRSPATGACMEPETSWYKKQAAFFQFQVGMDAGATEPSDVAVTVDQPCVYDASKRNDCGQELEMFVIPCNAGQCAPEDTYPTPSFNRFRHLVYDGSGTIFIPREHPDFCDPRLGICNYYVGVYPVCGGAACPSAQFQVSYSTAAPQLIAHACMDKHECLQPAALLAQGSSKAYEMYVGEAAVALSVRVEACSGQPDVYMCHTGCTNPFQPGPGNSQWSGSTATDGVAFISVSSASGTYYLDVVAPATGASSVVYQLSAATGDVPLLYVGDAVEASSITDSSVSLSWPAPTITVGGQTYPAANVQYTLYRSTGSFPTSVVATTACGLEAYAQQPGATPPSTLPTGSVSAGVGDLAESTEYTFALVATCGVGCAPAGQESMSIVLPHAQVETAASSIGVGTVILIVLAVLLVPGVIISVYCYRKSKAQKSERQYDMVDVSGLDAVVSQPVTNYRPLLDDGGDDDGAGAGAGAVHKSGRGSLAARVAAGLRGGAAKAQGYRLQSGDDVGDEGL